MKLFADLIEYFNSSSQEILSLLVEHIELTVLALVAAILIGVPLGILIAYIRPASKPVLAFANVVQAVPSMALLGLAIPVFGIGMKPAIFLVVIYSLLPIIKNTYAGLMNISDQMLEAAEGIGLTKSQILFKVRLPMALPVIMTGVRISAVSAVGLMTLAAYVGGGGLGYLVFSGIRTVSNVMILAGAIPACILALLVDRVFAAIETIVTPVSLLEGKNKDEKRRRKKRECVVIAVAVALLVALFSASLFQGKKTADIRIASMDFSENEIFAYMLSEAIERDLGIDVETIPDLGAGSVCLSSIESGENDGYVDYTGTLYVNILKNPASSDVEQVYTDSVKGMKEQYGLDVLNSLNVNNTYTLSTTKEIAEQYGLETISDLKKIGGPVTICSTLAFMNREDGLLGVEDRYGINFNKVGVDGSARYTALMSGEGQVIDAYSTDGLLKKFDLVILEDDQGVFPPYYAVPVFREEIMEQYPEIADVTEALAGVLSTDTMAELNYLVDEEGQKAEEVAHNFLVENLPEYARK